MTIAELKRQLTPGRKLTLDFKWLDSGEEKPRKDRTVKAVRSKDIILLNENGQETYLPIPKASELTEVPGGFQIRSECPSLLTYLFVEPAE